jgi:hypothetical protein
MLRIFISGVVGRGNPGYNPRMDDEHSDPTPQWIETSALVAPTLLGAAAGLLLGDMMHRNARRGVGIGLGALGVLALLPLMVDGVAGLITGPRSRYGVRNKIQRIRDGGNGLSDRDEVHEELREQGLI